MPSVKELRTQRDELVQKSRLITEKAAAEKRNLNTEEQGSLDAIIGSRKPDGTEVRGEVDQLDDQIWQAERLEKALAISNQSTGRVTEPDSLRAAGDDGAETAVVKPTAKNATPEYRKAFDGYLRNGMRGISNTEYRALQADVDAAGGFLVMPQEMISKLIIFVNNLVFVRQLATVLPLTNAESIGVPSWDTDPADPNWTAEILTGTEDSSSATGKRELRPHPLAKLIKISQKLLRQSVVPAEQLVQERLGYKFGVVEETAFMTGSGSNQPLGLFTASSNGIDTGRDYSTGNTTTAIVADNLIGCKYKLKAQYQASPSLRWIFHRDAIRNIRQLKDGTGQYLWQPGIGGDRPETILDVPFVMSEYAPNTFTTGLYVGLIGDLKFYWIADSLAMTMQRLDELYAATAQVGFIGRKETDGMPVLAEAFVRVKLA